MTPMFIIVISNFDIVVCTNSKDAFLVKTVNNHAKFELDRPVLIEHVSTMFCVIFPLKLHNMFFLF